MPFEIITLVKTIAATFLILWVVLTFLFCRWDNQLPTYAQDGWAMCTIQAIIASVVCTIGLSLIAGAILIITL